MGFLGGAGMAGAAGGANQALQNFLNFYMQNRELQQRKDIEKDRLAEQERSRKATEGYHTGMMGIAQSREAREISEAEQAAAQAARERLAVTPTPQYDPNILGLSGEEATPPPVTSMGDMDMIRALVQANPGKFGHLIKPEKPTKKNYKLETEEKVDPQTGITFRRSFNYDPETKEKTDFTDWIPWKAKPEKEVTPTDKDKLYDSYVEQMKASKQQPMSRYQFEIWMARQKPDRFQELLDALNPDKQIPTGTTTRKPIGSFDKR